MNTNQDTNNKRFFYMCSVCFEISQEGLICHGRPMMHCDAGEAGSARRKPMTDQSGRMLSPAPRWFLEAVGKLLSGMMVPAA